MKVFVADDVNEDKLAPLRDAGIDVVKEVKLTADALAERIKDADGVIVRSATHITAELMDAAKNLRVIGRAGVGVDNIDVAAATKRGIVVMNAPDGNTITTAEHTIALLVSMARNVPQAHAKLQSGVWDKKAYVGVELNGKTLGVIGLGRIGKHVAAIASGFGMNIVGFDPFISGEQAKELGIEMGSLDDVYKRADFLTIHTPVTDETRGLIGREAFTKMKKGIRLVNAARGGLVDEAALLDAIDDGTVAAAALDVFATEPLPADSPLLGHVNIITTPHLGASTTEAQEGVAFTVAEQMRDFLLTGTLRGAVNAPAMAAAEVEVFRPFIELAEKLGRFQAQILDEARISEVRLEYTGELASRDAAPVTRAFLAGLLRDVSSRVNVVNALAVAEERGVKITTSYSTTTRGSNADLKATVVSTNGEQSLAGRVFANGEGRIVSIGNFGIEVAVSGSGSPPYEGGVDASRGRGGSLLVTKNRDVPGVIGKIGTTLGESDVNISSFSLGREEKGGEALAVVRVDSPVDEPVLENLRKIEAVILVKQVKL
ncbi:MAG: phosphoglycerate dehydrogenase [Pyrinomonadaceae bacterium]